MKIIILIALLLLANRVERHYARRFYITVSQVSSQITLANQSQKKSCMATKLDHYLNKADSTVAGLRNFQRKCFFLDDQSKQLFKRYFPSTKLYPLINCLKFFIRESATVVFIRMNKERITR